MLGKPTRFLFMDFVHIHIATDRTSPASRGALSCVPTGKSPWCPFPNLKFNLFATETRYGSPSCTTMGDDAQPNATAATGINAASGGAARAACLAEISAALLSALRTRSHCNIARLKQEMASKHGLASIPKLIELIAALPEEYRERLSPFLRTKPVRSASGVAVVAVMCKPHRCPHLAFTGAVCVYCACLILRRHRASLPLPPPLPLAPAPRYHPPHPRRTPPRPAP